MSARTIIANCPTVVSVCSDGNSNSNRVADHILAALTAAGYRILAPGELDKETVERCANRLLESVARDYGDHRDFIKAIRSLGDQP